MKRSWSCDTFVAVRDATADGGVIFGKNSDRPAGEVQPLRIEPARKSGEPIELAYLSVADADSFAHIGSAPFWCWGYEFGVNEHSVVIGNEAQFTRSWAADVDDARRGAPPAGGILGMELVRLGLERGRTALDALTVMTELLEANGQWGSGMFGTDATEGSYDNSYLIADRDDAWVLETSGREWVAHQIVSGTYSISNEPSIRSEFEARSNGLLRTAKERGWISSDRNFDYAASHVDPQTPLQVSHMRQRRSQQLLGDAQSNGGVELRDAKGVLRDHFEGTFLGGPYLGAARPDFLTLCMHEHPAGFTWGNTAASTIVELGENDDALTVVWYTPLPPCVGAYIPIFLEAISLPQSLLTPAAARPVRPPEEWEQPRYDSNSYWWRFQNLLDAAKGDEAGSRFTERQAIIRARFDELETTWGGEVDAARRAWQATGAAQRGECVAELRAITRRAIDQTDSALEAYFLDFAPDARSTALDARWL